MDERAREIERRLEPPLLVFALLTIPAIILEYAEHGEPWNAIAIALNWAIWLAFVAEVVIMLRVVPDRGRWLRDHPLDLAIVVLTPPFLPPALQAARVFAYCGYCAWCVRERWRGECSQPRACGTRPSLPCSPSWAVGRRSRQSSKRTT